MSATRKNIRIQPVAYVETEVDNEEKQLEEENKENERLLTIFPEIKEKDLQILTNQCFNNNDLNSHAIFAYLGKNIINRVILNAAGNAFCTNILELKSFCKDSNLILYKCIGENNDIVEFDTSQAVLSLLVGQLGYVTLSSAKKMIKNNDHLIFKLESINETWDKVISARYIKHQDSNFHCQSGSKVSINKIIPVKIKDLDQLKLQYESIKHKTGRNKISRRSLKHDLDQYLIK